MHSKYYWCLLLLCSFIFITLADEQPTQQLVKRQLELTGEDVPEALLDDEENSILEDDEEDEEATSSLNHIDEDDAKEVVEEITEWANADHDEEDGEEVEEDLVDDEDYEDDEEDEEDEHDHEHGEDEEDDDDEEEEEDDDDDEEEDDELDDEEVAEEEEEREADDESLDQEEKNALGEVNNELPPNIEPEAGKAVDWNQQLEVVPQEDHAAAPGPFDDGKAPMSFEQVHANAEYETKEQEGNLMDTEADDAGQDIPMRHDWNGDHEPKANQPKQIDDDSDLKEEVHIGKQPQRSASGHHPLLWLVAIAFVLVLMYRANSKSSQAKTSILPVSG